MKFLGIFLLLSLCLTLALGAPSEADSKSEDANKAVAEKKESVDRAVTVADASWENWLSQNSWNILTGAAGVVMIFAGIGAAFYYFYYLNYYGHYGGNDAYGNQGVPYVYPSYQGPYNGQYYATAAQGRSLDTGRWNFNWGQVIEMIRLAQETYEKFDYQNLECQKKALCELSHRQADFGETGRKITNTFSIIDTLETLPMPSIVLHYLKEYKEAVNNGRAGTKDCGTLYTKCGFSLKETLSKYQKKAGKSQPK